MAFEGLGNVEKTTAKKDATDDSVNCPDHSTAIQKVGYDSPPLHLVNLVSSLRGRFLQR